MPCDTCGENKVCVPCINAEVSVIYESHWKEQSDMFNKLKAQDADTQDTGLQACNFPATPQL